MILLTTINDTLTLTTTSVQDIDVTISALDITTTSEIPVSQDTAITSIASTTILSAPAASTQRQVKSIMITNKGTAVNTITLNKYNGTTYKISPTFALYPNEAFYYNDYDGFFKTDAYGGKVSESVEAQNPTALRTNEEFANNTITGTITSLNVAKGTCIGVADINATSVKVRWRLTTATTGVTWAEIFLAKGKFSPVGRQTHDITPIIIGYADISTEVLTPGLYTTTINVSGGQSIKKGDMLYVIFSVSSSGVAAVVRAQGSNAADNIAAPFGTTQGAGGTQPSLSLGNVYSNVNTATAPVWITTQLL